ncbi:MAG: hypothetical protein JKX93_16925 [Rhizobiaceae bacterium]|nr:hypothetical protein [Rhizobiaceae bacterium]
MFWRAKPTIDKDDEGWQLEAWGWLLENLGGVEGLKSYPALKPSQADFPPSGKKQIAHAEFVFEQVASRLNVDPGDFELALQDEDVDPIVGPLAIVANVPNTPLGTYQLDGNHKHIITVNPSSLKDLEQLIATIAHEICHPILLTFPEAPPGGAEAEEYATDLAMAFFGFGVFGGNSAFVHNQFNDNATGTQGWSISRSGYLTQNEWGYALALRHLLTQAPEESWLEYLVEGPMINFQKNLKYLRKNMDIVEDLRQRFS